MADRAIFQDGDDLSEQNLALMLALGNQTDYFERGCGLDVDLTDDTVDIGTTTQWGNLAIVEDSNEAYYLLPDQRTDLSLESNATNYVYIWVDKDDDDTLGYYISTTDAAPTSSDVSADGPIASLKRGEIDTSQSTAADATTELNPNPAISADSVTADAADIGRVVIGSTATVYVRSGGSDSNDGDSANTAKATIQNAINNPPVPDAGLVVVDIAESGATFTEGNITIPQGMNVHIKGTTDGSNNPDVTIDGNSVSGTAILDTSRGSLLVVDDVKLKNGDNLGVRVQDQCRLNNVEIDGQADSAVICSAGSSFLADSDCAFDASGGRETVGLVGADAVLQGAVDHADGADYAVFAEDNSYAQITGTITGAGSTSGVAAVAAYETSDIKLDADIDKTDAIAEVARDGTIGIATNATATNVGQVAKFAGHGFIEDFRQTPNEVYGRQAGRVQVPLSDTDGETETILEAIGANVSDDAAKDSVQFTTGVSTGGTDIMDLSGDDTQIGCFTLVVGVGGSSEFFFDLVMWSPFANGATTINSITRNSPSSRSYSTGANDRQLTLTMGSDTYTVGCRVMSVRDMQ